MECVDSRDVWTLDVWIMITARVTGREILEFERKATLVVLVPAPSVRQNLDMWSPWHWGFPHSALWLSQISTEETICTGEEIRNRNLETYYSYFGTFSLSPMAVFPPSFSLFHLSFTRDFLGDPKTHPFSVYGARTGLITSCGAFAVSARAPFPCRPTNSQEMCSRLIRGRRVV